jgi:hypothetical protein
VLAFAWSDAAYIALSIFLLALAYAFVRLGGTFGRASTFIKGTQEELLPVIDKVGGTVDRVNAQLDKMDVVTDSAVDTVDSVDTAVRAVSFAITRPVQKLSGLAAALTYGVADLKAHRDWRRAVSTAKEAGARREQELADELEAGRRAGR